MSAAAAAAGARPDVSRALLDLARAEPWPAIPVNPASLSTNQARELVELAKADLRADGRLPRLP